MVPGQLTTQECYPLFGTFLLVDFSEETYLVELAASYVRGALAIAGDSDFLLSKGVQAGLKMHRFKRSELPRVTKCIGLLKGLAPATILDIGSGRGAFLWTMLDELPQVTATCVDTLDYRVDFINTVRQGGFDRVKALWANACELSFADHAFDVVCALEVLEHQEEPSLLIRELCRVGKHWLLVSVPSKPDNNPEHIQLFSADDLEKLLLSNGARSVQMTHVLNHRIALAKL